MDGIFSNDISNTLQMFTFPLEVVGLTLATIEVRYPEVAKWIAVLVTQVAARVDNEVAQIDNDEATKKENMGRIRKLLNPNNFNIDALGNDTLYLTKYQYRLLWAIGMGIVVMALLIVLIVLLLPGGLVFIRFLVLALSAWMVLGFLLFCFSFIGSLVVRFSDRFVAGRAVGTLGIIIAGFGVLGEAYQFTALMVV